MSDTLSVTTAVQYKRFMVPNFAIKAVPGRPRQEGIHPLPSTPIGKLAPEVLDALARAWIKDLYEKAGQPAPKLTWPA